MFAQESVMDIQETIDIRYEEIEGLKQNLSEDHYMNPEQEDELEELITKAIKFGELCAKRDAKAQAVPEGFVLVPKEPTDKTIAHMINTPIEVNLLCDHADTFLSEGEAYIAYKAMIEAQEPAND